MPPVQLLIVCSHNRTRSVMVAAMLDAMLASRLGADGAVVESGGFGPPDLAAIPDAVDAMARRGFDITGHRSRPVTPEILERSDLVLTAERDHVVRIAMIDRPAFARTMTLPEFLDRADDPAGFGVDGFGPWIDALTAARTTGGYLRDHIGEIADPTGSAPSEFEAAVRRMHEQCAAVADLIDAHRPV